MGTMHSYHPHSAGNSVASKKQSNNKARKTAVPSHGIPPIQSLTPSTLIQLQKTIGNRAVQRLLSDQDSTPPIQRVIHQGKTHRSKPYVSLKLSGWYKKLNDTQKAFALQLHGEDESFTKEEAEAEIERRINRGDSVPNPEENPKAERLKKVREYINEHAPKESDESFKIGKIWSEVGEEAYDRLVKRYKKTDRFKQSVSEIENNKPGLFNKQTKILENLSEWERIVALSSSIPQSYNFDLGGVNIKLDGIDVLSNNDRDGKREGKKVNLQQVFISQNHGMDSYWNMSDSEEKIKDTSEHKMLRFLEVERDPKSAFTTFFKDLRYKKGQISNKKAFGDRTGYAFQEFKGASKPTTNMRRMQIASSYHLLKSAREKLKKGKEGRLGRPVNEKRPITTVKRLHSEMEEYRKDITNPNKRRRIVKEAFRLIRARIREDISSDDDESPVESEVESGIKSDSEQDEKFA